MVADLLTNDNITTINQFCTTYPIWSFCSISGNGFLISCNFVTQDELFSFNPDDGTNSLLNPLALLSFFDNEVQSVTINENQLTITTIMQTFICDGDLNTIETYSL
jgi:hypothetical protein